MNKTDIINKIALFQAGVDLPADTDWEEFFSALETHPDLKKAFEAEQSLSERESELLRAVPVPEDLLDKILALEATAQTENVVRFPSFLRMPLAAAAVFALGFTLYVLNQPTPPAEDADDVNGLVMAQALDMADLKNEIIRFEMAPHFQFRNSDLEMVKGFLKTHGKSNPDSLFIPAGLHGMPTTGCNVMDVQGHTVSMICFQIDSNNRVHLFAVEKSSLREPPPVSNPQFEQVHQWPAATWSDDRHSYFMLTREASPDRGANTLRSLLISQ